MLGSEALGSTSLADAAPSEAPVTVATDVGVLTLTGLAPTFASSNSTTVQPGVGALTLTGLAPTFSSTLDPGIGRRRRGRHIAALI